MKWMSFIHLKEITKLLTKKRINRCNQLTKSKHSKERMTMTNTKIIITKKRRNKLTHDKKLLYNRKL